MLNHQFKSVDNQVQKTDRWHCSHRWWLAIFVFASSNWLTALSLLAASPPPGTVIDNQATGSFTEPVNNTEQEIESNIVRVEIAEITGITITGIATEEAPSNVNGAGANQNDGNINPNDVVYFIYRIANVGNDPTQFFIPGAPSSITGGSLQGNIEIIEYDPDGSGATAATDLSSSPVIVPDGGISTGDPNALDLPNGSIPAEGTVTIRVPVKLNSTLGEGATATVVMGDTGNNDNSTETQNQVFIAGDRDVYTQDNPDGTIGEADGNPINGDATNQRREASYSQEVEVTLTTAALDYGDAPNPYPTAQIQAGSNIYLGSTAPDSDTGSWHNGTDDGENATDDDTNDNPSALTAGNDEEDSVVFNLNITDAGTNFSQDVRVTNNSADSAFVRAWIDFDRDGIFDANEVSNEVSVAGNAGDTTVNLSFSVPSDISSGPSFARVIVSDTPNIPISGQGVGEIEDHIINIGDEDICNFLPNTSFSAFDFSNATGQIGENLGLTSAVATYKNAVVDLDGIPLDVRATVTATEGQINKFGNGTVDGRPASEWYLSIGNSNANSNSSAQVRLEFFLAGTNTPRPISGQFATGDIDDKPAPNGRLEALLLDTTDFSGFALDGGTTIANPYTEGDYTVFEGTGDRSDQPDSFVTYSFNNQSSVNLILRTTDVEGTPSAGFPINGRIASEKITNPNCNPTVIPTDYSDAPTDGTSYGVASHALASGIQIGSAIDPDSGSLASANADGDDNDGTDDDDAFNTLPNVPSIGEYSLNVPVNTTGNVTLHGWVDFDKDGQFEASEYTNATVTSSGDIPLSWSVPAGTTPGDSYARFRLTSDTLTDDGTSDIDERSIGSASDGEVEDYPVTIELTRIYDYGDAPDTAEGTGTGNYQTTANDDGAAQVVINDPTSGKVLSLGENVDADTGNLENVDALADDEDGTPDDEDGVESFPTLTIAEGQTYTVSVTAKNNITEEIAGTQVGVPAYLVGFIDFNKDGDFTDPNTGLPDPGERSETVTITSGNSDLRTFDVTFTTPAGMTSGDTYARFRLGQIEATAQSATGASAGTDNGEIEDYKIAIASDPLITGNVCYSVADSGDTLTKIDRVTGAEVRIGDTGTINIEAIAYSPFNNTLYAVDANQFGRINTTTGTFTPIGTGVGSNFDIDGLTVDPYTGQVYGSVRTTGNDLLIEIDPATGQFVPGAFVNGSDFVEIAPINGLNDIDDITIDPDDGQLYGIANQGANSTDTYVRIDRNDGSTTLVGSFGFPDVEGLTAFNDGNIYMTTGDQGIQFNGDNKFYSVNKTSGNSTEIAPLDIGYDYESIACLTGPPNSISGKVFLDSNNNGTNDSESGTENVTVELYRDVNNDGTVDAGDILLTTQVTNSDGDYNFLFAATGAYVLAIDPATLPGGNTLTTDNIETANLNGLALSDTDNDFGHRASPQVSSPAFVCDSSLYIVIGQSRRNDRNPFSQLNRINRSVAPFTFDPIGPRINEYNYNALAYNPKDNYIYAIVESVNSNSSLQAGEILRIGSDGVPVSLGLPQGDTISYNPNAGTFLADGTYVVGRQTNSIYTIDVTTTPPTATEKGIVTNARFEDFAVNPYDTTPNRIYGVDDNSDRLVYFNLNNPTSGVTPVTNGDRTLDHNHGSQFYDLSGNLIYRSASDNRVYQISPDGNLSEIAIAPPGGSHDGASCFAVGLEKEVDATEPVPAGDRVTYSYRIGNSSDTDMTVTLTDDLRSVNDYSGTSDIESDTPVNGTYTGTANVNTPSGTVELSNNDQTLTISDINLAPQSFTTITAEVLIPSEASIETYYNQASIVGLPSGFVGEVRSDYPPSATYQDPTPLSVTEASDPNLLLVKRITAINPGKSDGEIQFNSFVNDDSNDDGDPNNDPDNDPNWPENDDIYLRGATTVANVLPGDEVEYTIYFLSNGDEDATNVRICDVIPDNMSFVSNSYDGDSGIRLLNSSASGATPTDLTNVADSDGGTFYAPGIDPPTVGNPPTNLCQKVDSAGNIISVGAGAAPNINGAVVVEIESLPEATAPGTPDNSYGFIRFRAKVQ